MPHPLAYLSLFLAAAPVLGQDGRSGSPRTLAQLRVQQRIIVRIPRLPVGRQALDAPPIRWEEKKAPKCLPMDELQGASLAGRNSIDLIAGGEDRFRAVLDDDCSPMDFYSGFYLKPTADGMVCAGRDAIRARSGGSCRIAKFRKLIAKR